MSVHCQVQAAFVDVSVLEGGVRGLRPILNTEYKPVGDIRMTIS
jgi:hypothetical protein